MTDLNLDKNYLLQITNELYRITLLFPKKEPLRYKLRNIGNDILANFVDLTQEDDDERRFNLVEQSNQQIEVLEGFLDLARQQNWVRMSDLLNLQKEYNIVQDRLLDIYNEKEEKPKVQHAAHVVVKNEPRVEKNELSERQKMILRVLKNKEKAQVGDLKEYFPDVSKRTIRRDLKELIENETIKREGQKSNTFYHIQGI